MGYVWIAAHHNRSGQLRTVVRRRSRHPQRHHALHRIADRRNDLPALAASLAPRTYFAHLRQIKFTGGENAPRDFCESGHRTEDGSLDMYAIVRALCENGFDGYVRPDHGRNIWGEDGKPGYGLYDRALGACYLSGLFEAVERTLHCR